MATNARSKHQTLQLAVKEAQLRKREHRFVEVLLKQFMKLWEIRNEEVHGKTTAKLQEKKRKTKLSEAVLQLNDLKEHACKTDAINVR
jgi:hypothetical protein